MNIVDLHVHSNRSDGSLTPAELVDLAVEKGLSAFALTDHDTVAGIDEALVQYRMVSGSLSSNKFKSIQQVWEIQTQDEKIGKIPAAFHVLCFTLNALKKYLF